MNDEQKADLAVLADEIEGWEDQARQCSTEETRKSCIASADALQRIHDVLSTRLADAVQPAAGEGGLREALADMTDAFLSRHGCFPLDRNNPHQRHWHRAMSRAYQLVGQPGTDARRAAPSTSVPVGSVTSDPMTRLWWFLHILAACGKGGSDVSDDTGVWNAAFCGDIEPVDTLNRAVDMKLATVTFNDMFENSTAFITDEGKAFLARSCLIAPPAQEPTR